MYIFIDESGDIGTNIQSSRWFIGAAIITQYEDVLANIMRKTWRHLRKKHKHAREFHAFHEKDSIHRKVFKLIAQLDDIHIWIIAIDKRSSCVDTRNIYPELVLSLLKSILDSQLFIKNKAIRIIIDRKDTKKSLINELKRRIEMHFDKNSVSNYSISMELSHVNKNVQAADFIAWAIFRKYERGDARFYDMISHHIHFEQIYQKESPLL